MYGGSQPVRVLGARRLDCPDRRLPPSITGGCAVATDAGNPWSQRPRLDRLRIRPHDFILAELSERGDALAGPRAGWRRPQTVGFERLTSGRNVSRMLDFLWSRGSIMVSGRAGVQKKWDLAERCLPDWTPRDPETDQVVTIAAQKSLRALGVGTIQHIKAHYTRGRYPDLPRILAELEQQERVVRVSIEHMPVGGLHVHADDLPLLDRIEAATGSRARRRSRRSTT
ncbi:MAG: crosslink repair DNA glycosylase YcaQ family protein [Anaerolineae bacterium]